MKCTVCGIELSPKVYELHIKDCKKEEKPKSDKNIKNVK